MIISVLGTDSWLAARAIQQLKDKYLAKNDGAELIEIDEATANPTWADLQAVPLFATSRLVIIRRLGFFPSATQKILPRILADVPPTTVVVLWDAKAVGERELEQVLKNADKVLSAVTPTGRQRASWIKKRAQELEVQLTPDELSHLSEQPINDLWALETELASRTAGVATAAAPTTAGSEPFIFFNLVRRRDWTGLKKELAVKVEQGEPVELTIGSIAAAVRKELKGSPDAATILPFLLDIDLGLKTGFLEPASAAALIAAHLPVPGPNRVQWEQSWEEMAS